MGYDKWFEGVEFGILLDFVRIFNDLERVRFLSWYVDESAIGFAAFPVYLISFKYPPVRQKEWLIDIY